MQKMNSEDPTPLVSGGGGGVGVSVATSGRVRWKAMRCAGLVVVALTVLGVTMFVAELYAVRWMTPKRTSWREALQNTACTKTQAKVKDDDETSAPEVTIVITCGTQETDAISEMGPLLKSTITMASKPLRLVFFTDSVGASRLEEMFRKNLTRTKRRLWVDIYNVESEVIQNFAHSIELDPNGHHSGIWGTAKLMIPWLLPNLKRVAILDTDMVLVDDPVRLWEEFETKDAATWVYNMPSSDRSYTTHICSCVVLIDIERARAMKIYPDRMHNAMKTGPEWYNSTIGLYQPIHGDQTVYWLMMKQTPNLFGILPDRWNTDRCHGYYGAFTNNLKRKVSILHRNCGGVNSNIVKDSASPFFDYWLQYPLHWLQPSERESGHDVLVNTFNTSTSFNT